LPVISLNDALNNAYKKEPVEQADITKFKNELSTLLDGIKNEPKETEEHHKKSLISFLQKTWYEPDYYINTRGYIDLAIHNGNKSQSPVGVIIETKKPGKSSEMVSKDNLNVKSMHQLLLYFLRETINVNNLRIKHLIITNAIEWFIFDAREFYRFFLKDNDLIKIYKEYNIDGLFANDTQFFYTHIATKAVEKIKKHISFVHINLNDYGQQIRNPNNDEDEKLLFLYKILSPQHLLRKPFSNDNNSLNNNFYFELLYILGLYEEKEEGKKVIIRNPKGKRQNASLLESTIFQLSTDIRDEAEQFNTALELVITWINRILFLKLLEAQLLKYQNGNLDYSFLNINTIKNYNELSTLFFKVLACESENREDSIKGIYKNIPYLNSSLFDKTLAENKCSVSSLENKEIDYFSSTVLKDENGDRRKGKINSLEYIFTFLDAYDFSSESGELIKEKHKTIINASVLGLIFEKINGYKDGSYFTPGFVTSFICSEAIKNIVVSKFNTIKKWNAKNINDIDNKIDSIEISEANAIINSIKILDPAAGSGHFLVSALNEIIAIKSFLGILVDKEGRKLKDYKVSVENDELNISDTEDGKDFEYKYNVAEKQRIQETIFNEKRQIIENSLFGVDINTNSVNICRLRLWIELLKNAYYTKESKYKELETLPNLELNIKSGNSLISRFDIDIDISEVITKLDFTIQDYKTAVLNYKNSTDRKMKQDLTEKINKIKDSFRAEIKNKHKYLFRKSTIEDEIVSLTKQEEFFKYQDLTEEKREKRVIQLENELAIILKKLDEFEHNKIYNGAFEWRLEFPELLDDNGNFSGFDAVIGNPPYGILNKKQNKSESIVVPDEELEYYKENELYTPAAGGMLNIFRLFIVRSISLLRQDGIFSQIFPLAFTGDLSIKNLRKYIFDTMQIHFIEAFPERDDTNRRVFDEVKMSVCILQCQKKQPVSSEPFYFRINNEKAISIEENKNQLTVNDIITLQPEYFSLPLTSLVETKILLKAFQNSVRLNEIGNCKVGEVDMTFCKSAFSDNRTNATLLKGAIIDRYLLRNKMSQGEIVFIDEKILHKIKKINMDIVNGERIVMQGITGVNEKIRIKAMIVKGVYCANSLNFITLKKKINKKYLLGILNSKLINFIFKQFNTNSNVNGYEINNLPIVEAEKEKTKKVSDLVGKIISEKEKNHSAVTSSLENELDNIVYSLYQLDKDEIKLLSMEG
jgi:Alw26I/Eco31I/Esp3I family type II restriction m6 adenine DNA methyltransferase